MALCQEISLQVCQKQIKTVLFIVQCGSLILLEKIRLIQHLKLLPLFFFGKNLLLNILQYQRLKNVPSRCIRNNQYTKQFTINIPCNLQVIINQLILFKFKIQNMTVPSRHMFNFYNNQYTTFWKTPKKTPPRQTSTTTKQTFPNVGNTLAQLEIYTLNFLEIQIIQLGRTFQALDCKNEKPGLKNSFSPMSLSKNFMLQINFINRNKS
eukprot:TRINITY_DN40212_c0_g1_i10.p2 TRINITY_DN40212_c0_g1~~TRINITY_DN40212_c0_g1_i10.p2  ORF type:complete len:209 (-),score=-12.95 TRINITY_DN40212_c0_g1_i10:437-1063(-)